MFLLCLHSGLRKCMSRFCMRYTDTHFCMDFLTFNTGKTISSAISSLWDFLLLFQCVGSTCNVFRHWGSVASTWEQQRKVPRGTLQAAAEGQDLRRNTGEQVVLHRHRNSVLPEARQQCTAWEQAVTEAMSACCRTPFQMGVFVKDTQAAAGWAFPFLASSLL